MIGPLSDALLGVEYRNADRFEQNVIKDTHLQKGLKPRGVPS